MRSPAALTRDVALCSIMALLAVGSAAMSLPPGRLWDLGDFILAGRSASAGLNPYTADPTLLGAWAPAFDIGSRNINPPVSVLLCQLIAPLDPGTLRTGTFIASLGAYSLAVLLLAFAYRPALTLPRIAWAFALAGLWDNLYLGQVYAFLALAVAVVWLLLKRDRLVVAGIILGAVAAIKPNFLVVPALLFAAGYRRPAALSAAVFGALTLLPIAVYGPRIYSEWLAALPTGSEHGLVINASLLAQFSRLGSPVAGVLLSGVVLLGLAAVVWVRRPGALDVAGLGVIAAVLAGPTGYIELGIVLLPIFLSRAHWSPALIAAAALMLVPHQVVGIWSLGGHLDMILAGSVHFTAYVLVLLAVYQRVGSGPSLEANESLTMTKLDDAYHDTREVTRMSSR